jgi:rhodanese-related sulfurtransferase
MERNMLSFFRPSGPRAARISANDAVLQSQSGDLIVIDVREPSEIAATGRAKGSLHVPLGQIATRCNPDGSACPPSLSRERPVALYCASGARSSAAAAQLLAMGYETVYNLGSLRDWHAGGGAVVR